MSAQLLKIDQQQFEADFDRNPHLVEHAFANHPLFELDRLMQLCQELPAGLIEYNRGDIPIDQDGTLTPANGLSPEETIRRIGENGSWLVIKNVEKDPQYCALLHETLALVETLVPDMNTLEGFIFISSPGSVTPYHMDPEHNYLLQVRGTKEVSIFDPSDRTLISEQALETFWGGDEHRNMKFKDEYQQRAQVFSLTPGVGVHFPVTAPHWVKVGPEVSISFSVTFRSRSSKRQGVLHTINRKLRKVGITPTPVGASTATDNIKFFLYSVIYGIRNRLLRSR